MLPTLPTLQSEIERAERAYEDSDLELVRSIVNQIGLRLANPEDARVMLEDRNLADRLVALEILTDTELG